MLLVIFTCQGPRTWTMGGGKTILEASPQLTSHTSFRRRRNSIKSSWTLTSVHSAATLWPWGHRPQCGPIWICVIGSMTKGKDTNPLHSGPAVWCYWGPENCCRAPSEPPLWTSAHLYEFNFGLWSARLIRLHLCWENWSRGREGRTHTRSHQGSSMEKL